MLQTSTDQCLSKVVNLNKCDELGCLEVTEDVLDDADDREDDLDLYEALMKILKVGKNAARVISLQNTFHHDAHDLISC